MKIHLIAVGNKMPAWVKQGYDDYARRLRGNCQLELIEINGGRRTQAADISKIVAREGQLMIAKTGKSNHVVALDVAGKCWDTEQLARRMKRWQQMGKNIDLLVGGPEGLSQACQQRAHESWSLSPLTLPHPLVRILIAESLYRAWSFNHNHPYHRA